MSLVLNHALGWALLILGKKIDIPAQFDDKEWVFLICTVFKKSQIWLIFSLSDKQFPLPD